MEELDFLISICILSYNKIIYTKKCLESLMTTTFPGNTEIIVIDNNSTDGTKEWLLNFQDKYSTDKISIVFVSNKKNYGATAGRTQACSIARGKYIVTLDNDIIIFDKDWLKKMLNYYCENPEIGILGPKLIFPHEPYLIQHAGLGVTIDGKVGYWGYGKNRYDEKYNQIREVQGLASACWLTKKEIFAEFGYFDDIFYPVNFEDIDFCYRIREKGYKSVYFPLVELYHEDHVTTKNSKDIKFIHGIIKNGKIFKERWQHVYNNEITMTKEEYGWKLEKN